MWFAALVLAWVLALGGCGEESLEEATTGADQTAYWLFLAQLDRGNIEYVAIYEHDNVAVAERQEGGPVYFGYPGNTDAALERRLENAGVDVEVR